MSGVERLGGLDDREFLLKLVDNEVLNSFDAAKVAPWLHRVAAGVYI